MPCDVISLQYIHRIDVHLPFFKVTKFSHRKNTVKCSALNITSNGIILPSVAVNFYMIHFHFHLLGLTCIKPT